VTYEQNVIYIFTYSLYLLTYLLAHSLTPYGRDLLEKLTGLSTSQEIPRILWNPKVHYRVHKFPLIRGTCEGFVIMLYIILINFSPQRVCEILSDLY